MGFPLSRFQQLSALCTHDEYIVSEFSKFRLTAIVLHQPENTRFQRKMTQEFEHMHNATGEHLAFISFLNPPVQWAQKHRGWMDLRESLVTDNGNYSNNEFIDALCFRLSINSLPAIVLTNDLNSRSYAVLPTNEEIVVDQLVKIGKYATNHIKQFSIESPEIQDFLSTLGNVELKKTLDSEFLSTNIADIMAVFSMNGSGASSEESFVINKQATSAKNQIIRALSRNKSRYDSLLKSEGNTSAEQIDIANEIRTEYLGLVLKAEQENKTSRLASNTQVRYCFGGGSNMRNHPLTQFYSSCLIVNERTSSKIDNEAIMLQLTKNSRKFYTTFLRIKRYFTKEIASEFEEGGEELEYSPVCVELCKIVEEELNASVVQMIRQEVGIPMPEYYRKHCAPKKKIEIAKNLINLLDIKTKTLKTNTIGGIVSMLKEMGSNNNLAPFNTDPFLDIICSFKDIRNDTPHPIPVDKESFEEMNKIFDRFLREWIDKIFKVKMELQGDNV